MLQKKLIVHSHLSVQKGHLVIDPICSLPNALHLT
jgi:hypothetical protein